MTFEVMSRKLLRSNYIQRDWIDAACNDRASDMLLSICSGRVVRHQFDSRPQVYHLAGCFGTIVSHLARVYGVSLGRAPKHGFSPRGRCHQGCRSL